MKSDKRQKKKEKLADNKIANEVMHKIYQKTKNNVKTSFGINANLIINFTARMNYAAKSMKTS